MFATKISPTMGRCQEGEIRLSRVSEGPRRRQLLAAPAVGLALQELEDGGEVLSGGLPAHVDNHPRLREIERSRYDIDAVDEVRPFELALEARQVKIKNNF